VLGATGTGVSTLCPSGGNRLNPSEDREEDTLLNIDHAESLENIVSESEKSYEIGGEGTESLTSDHEADGGNDGLAFSIKEESLLESERSVKSSNHIINGAESPQ